MVSTQTRKWFILILLIIIIIKMLITVLRSPWRASTPFRIIKSITFIWLLHKLFRVRSFNYCIKYCQVDASIFVYVSFVLFNHFAAVAHFFYNCNQTQTTIIKQTFLVTGITETVEYIPCILLAFTRCAQSSRTDCGMSSNVSPYSQAT